ncbi:hypothetical protein [Neobacillus sp. 204]|uniref:hypothetical protein n=1 Tax=Neobacillus sp. 204 TaxID=3383351 RepID=UPI00397CC20D
MLANIWESMYTLKVLNDQFVQTVNLVECCLGLSMDSPYFLQKIDQMNNMVIKKKEVL